MEILEFYTLSPAEQARWTQAIRRGDDWRASAYLADRLERGILRERNGPAAEVLLLTEGRELLAYCTLSDNDEIDAPELTPWIGFVYTFPAHRGHRYSGVLIRRACELARAQGFDAVYLSSHEAGLYEKYGFAPLRRMPTIWGDETQVFRRGLDDIEI